MARLRGNLDYFARKIALKFVQLGVVCDQLSMCGLEYDF